MAEVRRSIASLLSELSSPPCPSLPVTPTQPIKGLSGVKQTLLKPVNKRRSLLADSGQDLVTSSFEARDGRQRLEITIVNPVAMESTEDGRRNIGGKKGRTGTFTEKDLKPKSLSLPRSKHELPSPWIVYPQIRPSLRRRLKVHQVHFDFRRTLRDSPTPVSVLFKT